ncbi:MULTISPECIES: hypothetical protein [unclassified Sphingomonas]|nr:MULTISPECIES: hypothetical protein [unclassified Sphingomonas]
MRIEWQQSAPLGRAPAKRTVSPAVGVAIAGLISLLMWAVIVLVAIAI